MDEELLELQRPFEFAQQAKSSNRLSDRNVVVLVQKLQVIDFKLFHTVSGKEYITPEKMRSEMVDEIKRLRSVSVIDITDTVGLDLYHVEKQAQIIVSHLMTLLLKQIFAIAQKECVDSFFSQNSFISYDALHKLAIPQPAQYLQIRYHEGILLVTLFVHPSMVGMLNFAADDVIEYGTWFDALSVLPTSFGLQDASNFLSLCPSVNTSLKDLFTRLEKEMETISFSVSAIDHHTLVKEAKGGHELGRSTMMGNANENGNKLGHEKVSEKKKGKSDANAKNSAAEKIMKMVPDFEEQDMEDPKSTLRLLASYLRPKLPNVWKDNERIRRVVDHLQKKLDEPFLNIQLYEKALDLFEEDPPTSVILHKHLLRTVLASIVIVVLVDLDKA
ncbi:unnamed protein product [Rhodiola kirilowii]